MSKVAVVYWSSTGNTEAMANAVADGIREKGGEAVLHTCEDFDGSKVAEYDAIAFGCPAMGDEVLEDTEFEPMFDGCKDALKGKNIALFGSYGWGDGEWMRNWEESCKEAGANLVCDSVICQEEPDDEATDACKALGAAFAHNFGLASSGEGPTANGKIAVIIGIVVVAVIAAVNSMRKEEA